MGGLILDPANAPTLPFERPLDALGVNFAPLGDFPALVELAPPVAGPSSMGVQTNDVTSFTQSGTLFVPRGTAVVAGDRVAYQSRKYLLMGAPNWDLDHPLTFWDFGWMTFLLQIDPAQLIADLLQLRGQEIALIPAVGAVTDKPGGGKDYGPTAARDPQTFVLFQVSSAETGRLGKGFDAASQSSSDKGTVRRFHYNMIGASDAVVELGDAWEDDLATYTVESVDTTLPFRVGAVATAYLKVQGHSFG
jgi:hypothetical protein